MGLTHTLFKKSRGLVKVPGVVAVLCVVLSLRGPLAYQS